MTGPLPCSACPLRCDRDQRLGDLEVYTILTAFANALENISHQCWSLSAATALDSSATILRTLGSGLSVIAGR